MIQVVPFVLFGYFGNKFSYAFRVAQGSNFDEKLLAFFGTVGSAFNKIAPSFHPIDLLFGVAVAGIFKAVMYFKAKNAKKFRHNVEYGSARWGTEKDIAPYVDRKFENNLLLTETEKITMNGRPDDTVNNLCNVKHARNKNVLVIGGSGSGKTRFYVKGNILQMHSSYVLTDPKAYIMIRTVKSVILKNVDFGAA